MSGVMFYGKGVHTSCLLRGGLRVCVYAIWGDIHVYNTGYTVTYNNVV